MKRHTYIADILLLLFIVLIAFQQLVMGKGMLKWDNIDISFPWRYFSTEALINGYLPLWNPFSNMGFPQMGILETWYPIAHIIGLIKGRYNIDALHIEFIGHIWLASISFYTLTTLFKFKRHTRLILSIGYCLSGFFIGNAQHLGWIVSAAWLPLCLYYFLCIYQKKKWYYGCAFSISMLLFFLGGYLGIFISFFYLLICLSLILFIRSYLVDNHQNTIKWIVILFCSAGLFLFMSILPLYGLIDVISDTNRGVPLSYGINTTWDATSGALSTKGLISFFFPYLGSVNDYAFWKTDFALINCYIGILSPLFLFSTLIYYKKSYTSIFLFFIGLFFLSLCLPHVFPFRRWLYDFVPYMGHFRFPSLFRLFATFCFLLSIGSLLDNISIKAKSIRKWASVLACILVLMIIYLGLFSDIEWWKYTSLPSHGLIHFTKISSYTEKLFFQIGLHLISISLCILLSFRPRLLPTGLVFIYIIDMFLSTQLNLHATVINLGSTREINEKISALPKAYPKPSLDRPMSDFADEKYKDTFYPFVHNLAVYHKNPSSNGSSPLNLLKNEAAQKDVKSYQSHLESPIVYIKKDNSKKWIQGQLSIVRFTPLKLICSVELFHPSTIVYHQNVHKHWTVKVNNEIKKIVPIHHTYMSCELDKGIHTMTWEYLPPYIQVAFRISLLSLIFVFVSFLVLWKVNI